MKLIVITILTLLLFLGVEAQSNATIFVDPVVNNIKVGTLVGNKNLAFGVRNIAQEIINEQGRVV